MNAKNFILFFLLVSTVLSVFVVYPSKADVSSESTFFIVLGTGEKISVEEENYTFAIEALTTFVAVNCNLTTNGTYGTLNFTNTLPSSIQITYEGIAVSAFRNNVTVPVYDGSKLTFSIGDEVAFIFTETPTGLVMDFYGVFNESTGLLTNENATVTVHFAEVGFPNEEFVLNGTYHYATFSQVQYFSVDLGLYDREYWVSPGEHMGSWYVFNDTFTGYTINFLDFCGALDESPFVEAQVYVNGTLFTAEKREVDAQDTVVMSLVNKRKYTIVVEDGTAYIYGDLLMTDITSVQLVLRAVDFPREQILLYQYIRVFAYRVSGGGNSTGTIIVCYEDVKNQTKSVDVRIDYVNGTNAYTYHTAADLMNLTFANAYDNVSYQITVDVIHGLYGLQTWRQYLPSVGMQSAPWNLSFLGSMFSLNLAYLLPILLIVLVAGCFSVINAEVGAVLTVITAIIMAALGFIPIGTGALVTAFALAMLMGLSYAKRRYAYQ